MSIEREYRENYCSRTFKSKENGTWNIEIRASGFDFFGEKIADASKYMQVTFTNPNTNQRVQFDRLPLDAHLVKSKGYFNVRTQKITDRYDNPYIKFILNTDESKPLDLAIDPTLIANIRVDCSAKIYDQSTTSSIHSYKTFKLYFDDEKVLVSYNKATAKSTTILSIGKLKKMPFLTQNIGMRARINYIIELSREGQIALKSNGFVFGISGNSLHSAQMRDNDLRIGVYDLTKNRLTLIKHGTDDTIIKKSFAVDNPTGFKYGALMEIQRGIDGNWHFSLVNEEDFSTHNLGAVDIYEIDKAAYVAALGKSAEMINVGFCPNRALAKLQKPPIEDEHYLANYLSAVISPIGENEKGVTYRAISPNIAYNFQERQFTLPKGISPIGIMPGDLFWPEIEELKDEFIVLTAATEGAKRVGYISSDGILFKPTVYGNPSYNRIGSTSAGFAANRVATKLSKGMLDEWARFKVALSKKTEEVNKFEGLGEEIDDEFLGFDKP